MIAKLRCTVCGATCWVRAEFEEDVNALILNDKEIYEWEIEDTSCQHEDFDIVDTEYESDED